MSVPDIISLEEAKIFLKLLSNMDGDQESQLSAILNGINAAIPVHCNRQLGSDSITEWRNGAGRKILQLKEYPATAVASVTHYDENESATTVALTDFWRDDDSGQLEMKPNAVHDTVWRKGSHNYKVVYMAGYSADDMPQDLKLAALTWVGIIWKRVEQNLLNVQSISFGGQTMSYRFEKIPAEVEQMLSRYVRPPYA